MLSRPERYLDKQSAFPATAPLLVTGGAGFIGANYIEQICKIEQLPVVNLDALTYAACPATLTMLAALPGYTFVEGDINDASLVQSLFAQYKPRAIVHFAAESHVDRSIADPAAFIKTNVLGTANLLTHALAYWERLPAAEQAAFRFHHISTDEVYGSLQPGDAPFTETSLYAPSSPYAASKAAADHMVHAWHRTYRLPTLITHASNNYGPLQFPEKLIPLMITRALQLEHMPVYGDGSHIRDWLHVADHCCALRLALAQAAPGAVYNIGGEEERSNIKIVEAICAGLEALQPFAAQSRQLNLFARNAQQLGGYHDLITFVTDRKGHDTRYAIATSKIRKELGWQPTIPFVAGLQTTLRWYLQNQAWLASCSQASAPPAAARDARQSALRLS